MRPEIKPQRILIILGLAFFALSLSGCVYLRLLNFKNQLKAFDENVRVEAPPGLQLTFSKPVVRGEDFSFITNSGPTLTQTIAADTELWTWTFEKRRAESNHKAYSIDFLTRFESGLLTRMIIDESFVDLIGRDFILTMFRSIGDAKINALKRSAKASMDREALQGISLPTLANILDTMGEPTRMIEAKQDSYLVIEYEYEFNFFNPTNRKLSGQFKLAFTADPEKPDASVTGFRITGKGR